jgi:hypothetical protein
MAALDAMLQEQSSQRLPHDGAEGHRDEGASAGKSRKNIAPPFASTDSASAGVSQAGLSDGDILLAGERPVDNVAAVNAAEARLNGPQRADSEAA